MRAWKGQSQSKAEETELSLPLPPLPSWCLHLLPVPEIDACLISRMA